MKKKPLRLLIHWLLFTIVLAMPLVACDQEEEDGATAPSPSETETPSITVFPTPTIAPSRTPELTPTPTRTSEPKTSASPTPQFEYPDEPPQLPPSFGLDNNVFSSLPDAIPSSEPVARGAILASINIPGSVDPFTRAALGEQSHWNHAAGNVLIWSAVIVVGLAVPVGAFIVAFDNIPYRADANTWIWDYDVNIGGKKHTAELHGSYIQNGVEWEMYISKEGEYDQFKWYYGESDLAGTEGFWIMKENPSNPNELLRIDWERDPFEGTSEITYENIKPGGPENGGYIVTRITNDSYYDSQWDIYNKGKNNHTYIEWNRATEEGRVKDFKRFGNDEWHCWGNDHKDIEC